MQPVKCEWFLYQASCRISGAHNGDKLICFDHDPLGNGKHSRQYISTYRHPTRAEKTHHLPKKAAVFHAIESDFLSALRNRSLRICVIGIDFVNAVADEPDMWPGAQIVRNNFELLFRPPVVPVEKCDNVTLCLGNARVECGCLAAICLLDQTHIRGESADDFGGAIGRAIVHDDDFHFCSRKILLQDAQNGFFDVTLVVVCVDQDCDCRCAHVSLLPSRHHLACVPDSINTIQ